MKRMWRNSTEYRIAQNSGGVKLGRIDRFRVLARKTLANLQLYILATLVNLEFGWVKYWRMTFLSPNSPKFSPARILRYTVYVQPCSSLLINIDVTIEAPPGDPPTVITSPTNV